MQRTEKIQIGIRLKRATRDSLACEALRTNKSLDGIAQRVFEIFLASGKRERDSILTPVPNKVFGKPIKS